MPEGMEKNIEQVNIGDSKNVSRLVHNFYMQGNGGAYNYTDIQTFKMFLDFVKEKKNTELKKYKVALMFICLNPPYWEFIGDMVKGAKEYLLPGHDVDYLFWTDLPEKGSKELDEILKGYPTREEMANISPKEVEEKAAAAAWALQVAINTKNAGADIGDPWIGALADQAQKLTDEWYTKASEIGTNAKTPINTKKTRETLLDDFNRAHDAGATKFFDIDAAPWPMPTLMRYHLFLQQEELLKQYDYLFYCDIDMKFVNVVGDEILGEGLTAAQHPMYAFRPGLEFPLEPNPESAAYIKQPKHYFAGGFQGGRTKDFIEAMKTMKQTVDYDFSRNYTARWNDESHWNRYLFDHPPAIILSPSYVYPDSLIEEYYKKVWGRDYSPKLVTITKSFTVSREAGEFLKNNLQTL